VNLWRTAQRDLRGRLFVQLERSEFGEVRENIYVPDHKGQPWKIVSVDSGRAYLEPVRGKAAVLLRIVFAILRGWAWLTGTEW